MAHGKTVKMRDFADKVEAFQENAKEGGAKF